MHVVDIRDSCLKKIIPLDLAFFSPGNRWELAVATPFINDRNSYWPGEHTDFASFCYRGIC